MPDRHVDQVKRNSGGGEVKTFIARVRQPDGTTLPTPIPAATLEEAREIAIGKYGAEAIYNVEEAGMESPGGYV
jgi:hypothetical protein